MSPELTKKTRLYIGSLHIHLIMLLPDQVGRGGVAVADAPAHRANHYTDRDNGDNSQRDHVDQLRGDLEFEPPCK